MLRCNRINVKSKTENEYENYFFLYCTQPFPICFIDYLNVENMETRVEYFHVLSFGIFFSLSTQQHTLEKGK